jgi:hypothetical protein
MGMSPSRGGIIGDVGTAAAVTAGVSAGVYHFGSRALGAPSTLQETALSAVVAPAAGLYLAMQIDNTYDRTKQGVAMAGAGAATSYLIGGQNIGKAGLAAAAPIVGYYAASGN